MNKATTINNLETATYICSDTLNSTVSTCAIAYNPDCATFSISSCPKDESRVAPKETRSELFVSGGNISVKRYKDGKLLSTKVIMSDIRDIQVYNNVVVMTFADGTKTKAVLDSEDVFNIEQGLSICIIKKLLGEEGHSIYNKLIRYALKVMKRKKVETEKAKQKHEELKRKAALAQAKHERKKCKKKEEQIEIQKEAYLRAMKEYLNEK